ncbi:MAG: holo-ACP synthase [Lachnospiraceae bacterium]
MIKGIGTDILKIERIRKLLGDPVDLSGSFIRKNFSEDERKLCMMRKQPAYFLATTFAGKEAVMKALGIKDEIVLLKDIEILRETSGMPVVRLGTTALKVKEEKGIREILVSLSFEDEYAIAFAICR